MTASFRLYNEAKPLEGNGKRSIWCAFYDICLTKVSSHGWDNFHCEACMFEKDEPWPVLDAYMKKIHAKRN